jgi:hypothetical protein
MTPRYLSASHWTYVGSSIWGREALSVSTVV